MKIEIIIFMRQYYSLKMGQISRVHYVEHVHCSQQPLLSMRWPKRTFLIETIYSLALKSNKNGTHFSYFIHKSQWKTSIQWCSYHFASITTMPLSKRVELYLLLYTRTISLLLVVRICSKCHSIIWWLTEWKMLLWSKCEGIEKRKRRT